MTWIKNGSIAFCIFFIPVLFTKHFSAIADESAIFSFNEKKIRIEGNLRPFTSTMYIEQLTIGRYRVHVQLHAPSPSPPPPFTIKIRFPKDNINQLWNSQTWSNKSFFSMPSYDRAASDFSIISGLTINDQNQITFTCKDAYDTRFVTTYVQQKEDTLVFGLSFFEENPPLSNMQKYEVELLADFRNIHFSDAILEASRWRFTDQFVHKTPPVDISRAPVFSTWYPMHRNIPLENISRELDSLRNFNFKSILVDDGWRSLVKMKVDTSYIYEQESLKTMQAFDEKRRSMGFNLFLWYSLPFLGGNPVISEKFEGKYIQYKAPKKLHVLDPRYADVRRHLISTYINFYKNWQFDGFLFDFLDHFYPKRTTTISEDLGRDYVDILLAVESLSEQINARLKSINPTVFLGHDFEPVGPNRNNSQNLLSGFVGINTTRIVREKMVNNRLLYGSYTPFIEILGIHPRDESPELARKFQSIMFGNPYLSFFNATMSQENKQTIRFWLRYWENNYDVLMKGNFRPMKVSRNYPAIKAEDRSKTIYALYEDYTLSLPLVVEKEIDVINAKENQTVRFISIQAGIVYKYSIYNHLGKRIEDGILKTKKKNSIAFLVPEGGFIRFYPKN